MKTAAAAVMLSVTVSPVYALLTGVYDYVSDVGFVCEESVDMNETEFSQSAEEAFCLGIELFICDELSIPEEDVIVSASNFDSINMRAERITVFLKGGTAFSDHRAILALLSKNGFKNCEVVLNFD